MIQRMKNMVQRNFTAKVIALLVSIALWVIVMDDQNPTVEKEYTVAAALDHSPSGYKITQNAEDVKLQVRAQRSLFANVESGDFKAKLDLAEKGEGEYEIPVQVQLPQGFDLVEMSPETIRVTLDPFLEEPMRARIAISGRPASNVTIANITQNHEIVTVVGPKSSVIRVDRVEGHVDLDGTETEDLWPHVSLYAVNEGGEEVPGVRVIPSTLDVHLEMARSLSKKVVAVRVALGQDLPKDCEVGKVQVIPANIEIAGDDRIIGAIQAIPTETISLKEHDSSFTVSTKLVLPEGITVTNSEVSVNIVIDKKTKNSDKALELGN